MDIDLKWLKLHPQASQEFHMEAAGRDELIKEAGGRFIAPWQVELRISNNQQMLSCQGRVQTLAKLSCSRCLDEVVVPVSGDFTLELLDSAPRNDNTGNEDEIIYLDQDIFDIEPWVEAAIFINLPLNPLCKHDCKGICPDCGVNRNIEQCRCSEEEIDPRWEKLKNFR